MYLLRDNDMGECHEGKQQSWVDAKVGATLSEKRPAGEQDGE